MAKNQIDITIRAFNLAKKELDSLNKQLGNVDKTGKETNKTFGKTEIAIAAVGAASVLAAKQTLEFVYESTKLAARVETLGVVTQTLGKNAGYTGTEITALERAIQKQGITTQASRQSLALMMQAQLDLADSTDLARLAQDAAVIAGTNSSEAFQRLINVITSGNVRMARTMGLQVDFNKGYEEMAAQLGTTVEGLTAQDKAQSRANSVMKEGTQIAGAYEDAMDSVGKQLESTARYWEEYKVSIGESNISTLGYINTAAQDFLGTQTEMNKAVNATTEAVQVGILTEDEAFAMRYQLEQGALSHAGVLNYMTAQMDAYKRSVEQATLADSIMLGGLEDIAVVAGLVASSLNGRGLTLHEQHLASQRRSTDTNFEPEIGLGAPVTAHADGGRLGGGISMVGEEGYELIIGNTVIPHAESKRLMRLGLVPGKKFGLGGAMDVAVPGSFRSDADIYGYGVAQYIGSQKLPGDNSSVFLSSEGRLGSAFAQPSSGSGFAPTPATSAAQASSAAVAATAQMTAQLSNDSARDYAIQNEILEILKSLAKAEDIEQAVRTAVEQASY